MTPFEQGYKAFLDGMKRELNPFDGERCPNSRKRWDEGWIKGHKIREAYSR